MLTLSTRITIVRIALVPVLVALVLAMPGHDGLVAAAVAVFVVASVTDYVDGWLARRWQQVTELGNFLDTTADKLLVAGALVALLAVDRVNPWVVLVVIGREFAVLGLRAVAAGSGVVVSASIWGKLKFFVQVVGVTLAIWRPQVRLGPWWLDQWAMLVVALITAASAFDYLARFGELVGVRR
ncbi:MAG TPA: CDP-diacylglycerol--glycerol-3-phosphate 3-phosphatidyltransferase [Actinomycetes bacterium]|nr:CDP-diacylglycerol--glycerol-3-phosphate 3-phosphatidyltransferase [Actinomycetes bacterium]